MKLFSRSALVALCLLAALAARRGQQLPLRTSQEVFRLGGANAPEHYAFSATPRLVADESGHLYARVPGDGTIYIYSPEGEYIRQIGRRGEGPGEFQVAAAHGIVGDTLWVRNAPAPRISKFLKDGTHLQTFRTSFDFGYSFAAAAAGISGLLRAGHVYVVPPSPVLGVDKRGRLPVLVGELERLDTVTWLPNPRGLGVVSFRPLQTTNSPPASRGESTRAARVPPGSGEADTGSGGANARLVSRRKAPG